MCYPSRIAMRGAQDFQIEVDPCEPNKFRRAKSIPTSDNCNDGPAKVCTCTSVGSRSSHSHTIHWNLPARSGPITPSREAQNVSIDKRDPKPKPPSRVCVCVCDSVILPLLDCTCTIQPFASYPLGEQCGLPSISRPAEPYLGVT